MRTAMKRRVGTIGPLEAHEAEGGRLKWWIEIWQFTGLFQSGRPDLNQRPPGPQPGALLVYAVPVEYRHGLFKRVELRRVALS
jgi:hypothetical protein